MSEEKSGIGGFIKTSLVDFPETVSSAVFLSGCNLRCPYCYNIELAMGKPGTIALEEVTTHLEKRRNVLKGLVISGGEPLLNPVLEPLIKFAKKLGYKIKLDTNGTLPEKLEALLKNPELKPDYIAMDIKTNPEKYGFLLKEFSEEKKCQIEKNILKSIKIISALPKEQREWRTVLVPCLVDEKEIESIGKLLPKDASWYLTQFRNNTCLSQKWEILEPYENKKIEKLVSIAKKEIPGTQFR